MFRLFNNIIIGLLACGIGWGNSCVSTQAGNWSSASSWASCGGVVPGNGDNATITHAITVDVNTTVGTSAAASYPSVYAVKVSSPGSLTVAAALTVRGDVQLSNAGMIFNAGSGLTWDASTASSPSTTNYVLYVGISNGQTSARVTANGTSGSHVTITSNASGGNGSFGIGGGTAMDCGNFTMTYTDISRCGTVSIDCLQFANITAALTQSIDHMTFSSSGRVNAVYTFPAVSTISITNSIWSGSLSTPLRFAAANPSSGTRSLIGDSFDAQVVIPSDGLTITDTYFGASYSLISSAHSWLSFTRNFMRLTAAGASQVSATQLAGDISNSYALADNQNGNPHFLTPIITPFIGDGVIFEYTGTFLVDGGDGFINEATGTAGTDVATIQNCIVLAAPDGNMSSNLANFGGAWATSLYHNTMFLGTEGGSAIGDATASSGQYPNYQSNLGWVGNGFSGGALGPYHFYSAHNSGNPAMDVLNAATGGGLHHNAGWNILTGYAASTQWIGTAGKGYNTNTSVAPGANDVDLGTGGTGPNFVDSTRTLATWAVTRGSVAGTYLGRIADALTYLSANPYLTASSLWPYIRAGFRPLNAALNGTAADGGTIGAVPFSTGTGGSSTFGPVTQVGPVTKF